MERKYYMLCQNDRRNSNRYDCEINTIIYPQNAEIEGVIKDISLNGVKIKLDNNKGIPSNIEIPCWLYYRKYNQKFLCKLILTLTRQTKDEYCFKIKKYDDTYNLLYNLLASESVF